MGKIRKIEVTAGVSVVDIAEADLCVLCGCPADSVKHLMRRGVIVPTVHQGVSFETGPNAILLSDVMLQNGSFCNLAEFPVLQMLYRQGMILPGHPNNLGRRPLLIGLQDQVEAQLDYIHRGNYGLLSADEMIAAGTEPERAAELMRLKLGFAYGGIRPSSDMLDAICLGDEPQAIRGGVTLRRLDLNVFEFACGAETMQVDLNLPSGTCFAPPYHLGSHRVSREYFAVIHGGDGDGWDPERPSMGSIIAFQGRMYLVDAGPYLDHQLTALGIGLNEVEGLFLTHAHDDHFAGLTTLLRSDRRIRLYATPLVRASATKKLAALLAIDEDAINHYFDVRDLAEDEWNNVEGLEVMPELSPHPVETSVMYFRALWQGGYKTYAHLADIASLDILKGMVVGKGGTRGLSSNLYEKVVKTYRRPVDIKKLDIGGGLIHGRAEDFRHDQSGKIILAHTSRPLTPAEKELGSGAPFGTVDVLIRGQQAFTGRNAYDWLQAYFPATPTYELRLLLNNPVESFNPQTILLREGVRADTVYMVLTGEVEMLHSSWTSGIALSAGSILGERAAIDDVPAIHTYRTTSFVEVISISADLYRRFAARNGLTQGIRAMQERLAFLRSTWLCSEALSAVVLNRISQEMSLLRFTAGEPIVASDDLMLIRSGEVERRQNGVLIETLGPNDFFGEESAVFGRTRRSDMTAALATDVYAVPGAILGSVPVVLWKLFETYERRKYGGADQHRGVAGEQLVWRSDLSVNIRQIDAQHQKLLEQANALLVSLADDTGRSNLEASIDALIHAFRLHCTDEESLMERIGYDDVDHHRQAHRKLLTDCQRAKSHFTDASQLNRDTAVAMLKGWFIDHILVEDKRYAAFFNSRGLF
jgi:hemerythrin